MVMYQDNDGAVTTVESQTTNSRVAVPGVANTLSMTQDRVHCPAKYAMCRRWQQTRTLPHSMYSVKVGEIQATLKKHDRYQRTFLGAVNKENLQNSPWATTLHSKGKSTLTKVQR